MSPTRSRPQIGFGYRNAIGTWTRENISAFDAFEITLDHYLLANDWQREDFENLVGERPEIGVSVAQRGTRADVGVQLDLLDLGTVARVDDAQVAVTAGRDDPTADDRRRAVDVTLGFDPPDAPPGVPR